MIAPLAPLLLALLAPPPALAVPSGAGAAVQAAAPGASLATGSSAARRFPAHGAELEPAHEEVLGVELDDAAPGPRASLVGSPAPGLFEVVIHGTGTGYVESFLLQLPPAPSRVDPSPLLVAFHKFGNSPLDIAVNTDFGQACWDRNWFLLAPLGASTKSFSSLPSQVNTRLAIELVTSRFAPYLDEERIYGVGFSMGGLNATSYAARHLDPRAPMFAALVDHTGTASIAHSYSIQSDEVQGLMEFWFGGTPAEAPFAYARSSVLDAFEKDPTVSGLTAHAVSGPGGIGGGGGIPGGGGGGIPLDPPIELAVRPESSLAHNLTHVPLFALRGELDHQAHLRAQLDALVDFLRRRGGEVEHSIAPGVTAHNWSTLDEDTACDWLAQHRLALPDRATTLADRDDRFFHFDVEQDAPGAFTPFTWSVDPPANRLAVTATENLARLRVHLASAGLDPERALTVILSAADGEPDEVVLLDVAEPAQVLRDGEPTDLFEYVGRARRLVLDETDAGRHEWRVVPSGS